MRVTNADLQPARRTTTVFRLLAVALAALALLPSDQPVDPRLALVGAGYLAFAGLLWLTPVRLDAAWLVATAALVDAAAVSGSIGLAPATAPPLWALYLFPLAGAAVVGRLAVSMTASLGVAGYLATTWLRTQALPAGALWPVALLAATAFAVDTLTSRWLAEQRQTHAWREAAAVRESLRREQVLQQAATALAATLERQVVQDAVAAAGRFGLEATVALVDRVSERPSADEVVAETSVRLTAERAVPAEEVGAPPGEAAFAAPVSADLELRAWRADPPLDSADAAWLEKLASLTRGALERCTQHEQLQAEKARLAASLEAAPAPLALWDRSGRLVHANSAFQGLGLDGAPPVELPPTALLEEEITLGDPPRTFVVMTVPVAERQYVLSLYRDITRERQALRAKDELVSMIGHELRNPLTSIQGYSQMMARQLGVVQQQVNQLNRLIGDFIDASQLEGGQLPLTPEPLDLAELARAAAERFRGAHEGRTLRLELAATPPVEGDPTRLGQVLDNLLSNAAKYSPADSEIVLSVATDEREVLLSVHDHGTGIAPEHLPRLFDRSYRVPGADTERVSGAGLGLSIARDLVAAHGGRLWAESDGRGRGSSFWVALPVSRAVGARQLEAAEAEPG